MLTATTAQVQLSIDPQTLLLASNKEIAAKVLSWDTGLWGSGFGYSASEIERVKFQGDILRFELSDDRAIHIAASDFVQFWDSIQAYEAQMEATDAEVEAKAAVSTTVVEAFQGEGTAIDVIELEIGKFVEIRMGWVEETWEGELIHHIFFEPGDNEKLWLNAYRKSSERGSSRIDEDEEIAFIRALEAEMYATC